MPSARTPAPASLVGARVGVAALALALLASCGSGSGRSTEPTASTTATTAAPQEVVAPLNGLPTADAAVASRPAVTVKIENTRAARPQFGLEHADVVFEEVVEGGITRLAAVFQSVLPPVIGPVRSVRRTDAGIVTPLQGVFVYSGGAAYAVASISKAPVVLVDETRAGSAMFRDRSRRAPHNLFARGPLLVGRAPGAVGPPPALFDYGAPSGRPANSATVGFHGIYAVHWQYDPASRRWLRSIFGRPDVAASGVRLGATNVVVEAVQYQGGAGVIGAEAELVGQGRVWVLSAGQVTVGTWRRSSASDPGQLIGTDGTPIVLAPGPTWVELPDVSYPITIP